MKRLLFLLLTVHCSLLTLLSQAPQKFNYQAVVRDDAGNIALTQNVSIKISILQGAVDGAVVYSETHSPTTNAYGIVTLEIGGGTIVSGDLSTIDWGSNTYYMKVEMDATGGTTYTEMGISQILSVPYALHSKTADNVFSGDYLDLLNTPTNVSWFTNDAGYLTGFTESDPIFESHVSGGILSGDITNWNNAFGWGDHAAEGYLKTEVDGDITNEIQDLYLTEDILTITNNLSATPINLNPYLDNTNYWTQSGDTIFNLGNIGIGTTSPQGKLEVMGDGLEVPDEPLFEVKRKDGQTVFAVYPEGVRIYVEESEAKGTKGGFAIGGFNPASKDITNEYLRVTPDSVRVYVNDDGMKGTKGGFAIGGFTSLKGPDQELMRVTHDSVRIYINDEATKGTKGGFAIGGFTSLKGLTGDYLNVSGKATAEIIDPSDARILWYPNKEAFLTGKVLIESADSVGTNSMATGFESKAIGNFSQALGYQAIARKDYSTAIGYQAVANEINSFAFGQWALAKNEESYAFGRGAIAEGFRSFAFGSAGVDSAGVTTGVAHALGDYSFAIGQGSRASGLGSFTLGLADTASGKYSTAIGYKTNANGDYGSTAVGYKTEASGSSSTAIGYETKTSGTGSTAMGWGTVAIGLGSTAMGMETTACGGYSTTMGCRTTASGAYSTAMGWETTASGLYSTATGKRTIARAYNSFVIGVLNDTLTTSSQTLWQDQDPLFIIGNGTHTTARSSALTVLKNGNVGIGTMTPSQKLDVEGNITLNNYLYGAYGTIARSTDEWLRLNDGSTHTSGVLIPNVLRADGGLYAGDDEYIYRYAEDVLRTGDSFIVDGSIGVNISPTAKLHVNGGGSSGRSIECAASGTNVNQTGLWASAGTTGTGQAIGVVGYVYRDGTGDYYSGYFRGNGTGGDYYGLKADLITGVKSDIAEYILDTENNTEPGDVVIADPNNSESIVKSFTPYDETALGVISTSPHMIMNNELIMNQETGEKYEDIHAAQLALAGRVPVKVTDENGSIEIGDFITTSSKSGYGMKWSLLDVTQANDFEELKTMLAENERRRGAIIGKALEAHDSGDGKIVVLISLQ